VKDNVITGAWGNLAPPLAATQNRRYSAELSEDPNILPFASTRKDSADASARRPATHDGRANLSTVPEHSAEDIRNSSRSSTSAGRPDSTRKSSSGTPRNSDSQRASVRSTNTTPRTVSSAKPDGRRGDTPARINSAAKIQDSKKSSMENLMKTAQENGLQKSSSGNFKYSEDSLRASSSRGSTRAAPPPMSAKRTDLQGSKRNSMEVAYSRLMAESDLPEVHKKGSIEGEDEDDMVNMGEEGDGRDEAGVLEEDGMQNSIDFDANEHEDEEIGEDIVESGGEDIEESGGDEFQESYDEEVTDEFQVYSTNEPTDENSDEEGQVVFDSAKNIYYDTKNKKPVNLY
jgi:hypothetical protein